MRKTAHPGPSPTCAPTAAASMVVGGGDDAGPADGNGASLLPWERWGFFCWSRTGSEEGSIVVIKVEAVVVRDRVETVMEAVEAETGHVGVTVVEAVGHGREKGITHEYRGRVFESRFLPKALMTFIVRDEVAEDVIHAITDAAKTGHVNGDGICWMSPVTNVTHNRTGQKLEEVEVV